MAMRRRDFLAGSLAAFAPAAVRAAEADKVYRLATCKFSPWFWPRFLDSLRQLGFVEGKNLVIDRCADENMADYGDIARAMLLAKPDVIAVGIDSQFISHVAKQAYPVPVVAVIPSLAAGLVSNIAKPEGNITGITADAGIEMQGKHLDILRQALPRVARVAYLSDRGDWEGAWGRAVLAAGQASGITIIGVPLEASAGEGEYRRAFETMTQQSAEALMYNGLPPNFNHRELIADLALQYRLPSIGWFVEVVENGHGLLAYSPDISNWPARLAQSVVQVLRGTKVADIPVSQPDIFVLAVNLKTAKSLGVQIPPALIVQADKVIE
jgi:putative ABC transport system substrate-binding protein